MLLSDWDTKDRRDVARGSNTAIFEHRVSRRRREARYLITDWGGSMGRWGSNIVTRGRWDPEGFAAQTPQFVTGVKDGLVQFGYAGQRTADVSSGIRVEDVRWLHRYLGRITDEQLRAALAASGASAEDAGSFARSLRDRITQLGRVTHRHVRLKPDGRMQRAGLKPCATYDATDGDGASCGPWESPSTDPPARDASDTARAAPCALPGTCVPRSCEDRASSAPAGRSGAVRTRSTGSARAPMRGVSPRPKSSCNFTVADTDPSA